VAEQVVEVAGETEAFLGGGEVRDGLAGLAQLAHGEDEPADPAHRETAEQARDEEAGHQVVVGVDQGPGSGEDPSASGDGPACLSGWERRPEGDGGVDEEDEPGLAEGQGENGGEGRGLASTRPGWRGWLVRKRATER
jgi:hypothetical protein